MNTAERIVESYFRYCRNSFTIPDVKVVGGRGRQFDLLAFHIPTGKMYHVETSVASSGRYFQSSMPDLFQVFQNKFFGLPEALSSEDYVPNTDDPYYAKVTQTYQAYGFGSQLVIRVWCSWTSKDYKRTPDQIRSYFSARGVDSDHFELLDFRDTVIPELMAKIGSANYDDDALRTFSLLAERAEQCRLAQ